MTSSIVKIMLACAIVLTIAACGRGDEGGGGSGSQDATLQPAEDCTQKSVESESWPTRICYFHKESINGQSCSTGKREFRSYQEYCTGLLNDELNNYCARAKREEDYQQNCKP